MSFCSNLTCLCSIVYIIASFDILPCSKTIGVVADSVRFYTSSFSLSSVIERHSTLHHTYDDDSQLQNSATPSRLSQSGWKHWKRVSGILCDRRISLRVMGKVYKMVALPAMMYGTETWAVKKAQEKKLDVAQRRMLRWMSGVTTLNRIRNEIIRGTTKVGEISNKVQESRLKWYGHVLRREDEYVGKRVMGMEVSGKRGR